MKELNVHVYPSPLTHESRILRITDALARAGIFQRIEVVGVARDDLPSRQPLDDTRELIRVPRRLMPAREGLAGKFLRTVEWSLRVLARLRGRRINCINAHSLAVLPLCVAASWLTGAKLVYDTHELETETNGSKGIRQKLGRLVERLLIRYCDRVFVVGDSIADWYARAYGIARPVVVRNIPQFSGPVEHDSARLRDRLRLTENDIVFIYQGGFLPGRGIERLLRVFASDRRLHLVCMGSGPLQQLIADAGEASSNIHLIPPVAPDEVLAYTQAANVGLCLTENSCLSYYYSLPNKLFEYLHAGLPVIVSPLFEQEKLVREYGCGWVAPDDDAAFLHLLQSIDRLAIAQRRTGVASARAGLRWQDEEQRLIATYKDFVVV